MGQEHLSPFEQIRHLDDKGHEYWSARELGLALGYSSNYRNIKKMGLKAEQACENVGLIPPTILRGHARWSS